MREPRLDAVRAVQLALGDLTAAKLVGTVWEGYSPRRDPSGPAGAGGACAKEATIATLRAAFPSGHAELDRELARTLAMVEDDDPATLEKVAGLLTESSHPVDDFHYLIVLGRLRAPRPPAVTARVARALLALDRKLDERRANRDRYWPLRLARAPRRARGQRLGPERGDSGRPGVRPPRACRTGLGPWLRPSSGGRGLPASGPCQ